MTPQLDRPPPDNPRQTFRLLIVALVPAKQQGRFSPAGNQGPGAHRGQGSGGGSIGAFGDGRESVSGTRDSIVDEETEPFLGKRHWRRWKITGWFAGQLYQSGLNATGGTASHRGGDPNGFWVYSLPSWKHVLPRHEGRLRPYILWLPNWWWECQISQGFKIKGRHRPLSPVCLNICAACAPCPDCGQPYCGPDCVGSPL